MEATGLQLEAHPVSSIYLSKLAGRIPGKSKLHNTKQMSHVILAHKTGEFPCNAVNPRLDAPRQSQLEAVGLVISSKHPSSATFLAPSMADFLLNRFVLAQNGERKGSM